LDERIPGQLGVIKFRAFAATLRYINALYNNKFVECDTVSVQCSDAVGWVDRKDFQPVKKREKLGVGLSMVTISLEFCTSYSSSFHLHASPPSSYLQQNPQWWHSGTDLPGLSGKNDH